MPTHHWHCEAHAPRSHRGALGAVLLGMSMLAVLAACAAPAGPGDTTTPADTGTPGGAMGSIVGTWLVGADEVFETTPFLTITSDGSWTGSDGCNVVRGTWELSPDGVLTTTSGPSTFIGCDGKPLPTLFANATTASVDAGSLTLQDDAGEVLTLVAGREPLNKTIAPPSTPPN